MTTRIWLLTAPDGCGLGASAELCPPAGKGTWCNCPYVAVRQALAHTSGHQSALEWLRVAIDTTGSFGATRYEHAGYVLALVEVPRCA